MAFTVLFTESAQKDCKKLPGKKLDKIQSVIEGELARRPQTSGYRLEGELKGYYSIQVAEYRIVYQNKAAEKKVIIYRIRHRKDVYR